MPEQKQSARPKTAAQRLHLLRIQQLEGLSDPTGYIAVESVGLPKPVELAAGGRVVVVYLTYTQEVQEVLTVLTSMTREDRVWSAMYSVDIDGALAEEYTVPRGGALWRLASDAAVSVL